MSALGHEQTWRYVRVMPVIPLKADIDQRGLHVRFVPKADVSLPCNGYQRLSARAILAGEEQFRLGKFPPKSGG
jgi:hypothetical protein